MRMNPFIRSFFLFTLGVLTANVSVQAADNPTGTSKSSTLCVMSYNLRTANGDKKTVNAWEKRRPLVHELINVLSPDLIGTQEGIISQLNDIAADLPGYAWIGTGRDGGKKGEFMAIFYKKARLEPLETNHFWLSDTPEVVASSTWGNNCKRMVTWVKFRDRQTGKEFYHFNTHFDHQVQAAREKSSELIRSRVQALNTQLPVLLTGDFNAYPDNKAHDILVKDGFFTDTWFVAKKHEGEGFGTFNGFHEISTGNTRIDWILFHGKVSVADERIMTFSRDGHFPSDHFPLIARITLDD